MLILVLDFVFFLLNYPFDILSDILINMWNTIYGEDI